MELTRKDTKMIQGLSVLAMVCLHLFDRWDYEGLYQPLIFLKGIPLSFYFAQLSDFCVMGFAFCSGYAHMSTRGDNFYKRRLSGLLKLLLQYWVILILFSAISILVGQGTWMPGSIDRFVGTALLYNISYNGAWWYMYAYAILVVVSPIILRAVERCHPIIMISLSFVIYCIAYYVRFYMTNSGYLLDKFGPLGMTLFEYILGCIFYKTLILSYLHQYWKKLQISGQIFISAILLLGMLLGHTLIIPSLFIAPVTGLALIILFHFWHKPKIIEKSLQLIGRHSTNIWLTHMFFYLVLFRDFVYMAKYPLLIYILMISITLVLSYSLQAIQRPVLRRLSYEKEGNHP